MNININNSKSYYSIWNYIFELIRSSVREIIWKYRNSISHYISHISIHDHEFISESIREPIQTSVETIWGSFDDYVY